MIDDHMRTLEELVHEELDSGWTRIIQGLLKRVRKRLGLAAFSTEQVVEIEQAFKSWLTKGK